MDLTDVFDSLDYVDRKPWPTTDEWLNQEDSLVLGESIDNCSYYALCCLLKVLDLPHMARNCEAMAL